MISNILWQEIEEQLLTIKTGLKYIDNVNKDINIFNFPWKIEEINSITLIGCGTANNFVMAKYWFKEPINIDVNIDIVSELDIEKVDLKKTLYMYLFHNLVKQQILMQL